MPVKKKSCFQITSVTQAQVAANNAADDSESLDDPDESRIEEISSDVFEVCQTDYEHAACDGSSLEETLNNVGESEAGYSHLARQLPSAPGSFNTGTPLRNVIPNSAPGVSPSLITGMSPAQTSAPSVGIVQSVPQTSAGIASAPTLQSAPTSSVTSTPTTTGTCSSRFRVIKLDHGTGEPFRRGRWTCTEFYDKDPEGSVISRNLDTIRHNNTADSTTERDSGFGATAGSSIALSGLSGHGSDPAETSLTTASHMAHPDVQQQQQSYGIGQQHHVITGAIPISSSNKPVTAPPQQIQGTPHAAQPQALVMPGMNGSPQTMNVQKPAGGMPSAPQTQSVIYQTQPSQPQPTPPKQLPLGHQLSAQSSTIPGYQLEHNHQKHLPAVTTTAQTHSGANLTAGQAVHHQGPSPVPTPASGVQVLGAAGDMGVGAGGVPHPASQPASFPANAHLPQPTNGMVSTGGQPQMGQYLSSGEAQGLPIAPNNSVQNVPTASSSAAIPSVPASSIPTSVPVASSLPTQNTALSPSIGQQQPAQMSRNGTMASGAIVNHHPTPGFGQSDENRRKSDIISQFPAVSGKDLPMKPLIPEGLQLTHPTVNSLFGIPIQIDGDEDGNPSTAFYQAFQPGGKLRNWKALSDSTSGASVVAIDNKIEQAMDLVKSHLMYAVREEVEVLKEQIKELYERNSVLERENAVLKSLANSDQLSQLPGQSAAAATSNSTPQKLLPGGGPALAGVKGHSIQQASPSLDAGKPITAPPLQPSVTSA